MPKKMKVSLNSIKIILVNYCDGWVTPITPQVTQPKVTTYTHTDWWWLQKARVLSAEPDRAQKNTTRWPGSIIALSCKRSKNTQQWFVHPKTLGTTHFCEEFSGDLHFFNGDSSCAIHVAKNRQVVRVSLWEQTSNPTCPVHGDWRIQAR